MSTISLAVRATARMGKIQGRRFGSLELGAAGEKRARRGADGARRTGVLETLRAQEVERCAAKSWKSALVCIGNMRKGGVTPGTAAYNVALKACTGAGEWDRASALVDDMKASGAATPDPIILSEIEAGAAAAAAVPSAAVEAITGQEISAADAAAGGSRRGGGAFSSVTSRGLSSVGSSRTSGSHSSSSCGGSDGSSSSSAKPFRFGYIGSFHAFGPGSSSRGSCSGSISRGSGGGTTTTSTSGGGGSNGSGSGVGGGFNSGFSSGLFSSAFNAGFNPGFNASGGVATSAFLTGADFAWPSRRSTDVGAGNASGGGGGGSGSSGGRRFGSFAAEGERGNGEQGGDGRSWGVGRGEGAGEKLWTGVAPGSRSASWGDD